MIRAIWTMPAILILCTTAVLAQGNDAKPAPQAAQPPQVLSRTGTMYNGNNVKLQLPVNPNAYWADLWSGAPTDPTGQGQR